MPLKKKVVKLVSEENKEKVSFLQAIEEAGWKDGEIRAVYSDWLDEHGEHDEATRQRQYCASRTWLAQYAREQGMCTYYDERKEYRDEPEEEGNIYSPYGRFLHYLKAHVDGTQVLPYDTPYSVCFCKEMWDHFEVVTCLNAPGGEDRTTPRMFLCAC